MSLTAHQENYFKDSMVRDSNGTLLEVYHGSGAKINSFDPSFTGQGNDQYGSGFYFTTDKECAEQYTTARNTDLSGKRIPKLGGENNPNVVTAYLNLKNPIIINGYEQDNLSHILIPNNMVFDILKKLPTLYHLSNDEKEPNPLSDYSENFWEINPKTEEEFESLIKEMEEHHFQDTDLQALDILFGKYGTELRYAIYDKMGYDGIIVNYENNQYYDDGKQIVAWFPEQIKDINNLNPQLTSSLMDENYKEYEKIISCNDNELESSEELEWYPPDISI